MEIMDRRDIITVPYICNNQDWPQTMPTGIKEACIDNLSLVRVQVFGRCYQSQRRLCCVLARQPEVIPLLCGYYGFAPSSRPVDIKHRFNYYGDLVFREMLVDLEGVYQCEDEPSNAKAVFTIYMKFGPYEYERAALKCGGTILCSPWGYERILNWYTF